MGMWLCSGLQEQMRKPKESWHLKKKKGWDGVGVWGPDHILKGGKDLGLGWSLGKNTPAVREGVGRGTLGLPTGDPAVFPGCTPSASCRH